MSKTVDLNLMGYQIHHNATEKGFWSEREGVDAVNQYLAKLMLVDTEVSELVDAYVKERGAEAIELEFADILIRVLDLYQAMKEDGVVERKLPDVLNEKIEFNSTRPKKHNRLM